jgi:5-methylcytosine-specific restriction endonuclease McrA
MQTPEEKKLSRKNTVRKYYLKNKTKINEYISDRDKLPEVRKRRNELRILNRSENPALKRKEYDLNIARRRRSPLRKLANINNSNMSRKNKNSYKLKGIELWAIAKKQKMLCPFTGDKLTSENISLDHIIPRSKGGSNEPSNVRLVTKWVNLMRLNYTDEEFIKMCGKISNYCRIIK